MTEKWLDGFALRQIAPTGVGRPMRAWKSCKVYERLVAAGYVNEVADSNPFFRRFEITEAGRATLTTPNPSEAP